MKLKKYTEQQLRDAVANNSSYRKILQELNVAAYGGNYTVLKKAIEHFNIPYEHLLGQAWAKDQKFLPKKQVQDYLQQGLYVQSNRLKNLLLKENILNAHCSECENHTWLGKPIPLELDHINGDNKNNLLENLRLLCPNCHALTPTYRGKNKKK